MITDEGLLTIIPTELTGILIVNKQIPCCVMVSKHSWNYSAFGQSIIIIIIILSGLQELTQSF